MPNLDEAVYQPGTPPPSFQSKKHRRGLAGIFATCPASFLTANWDFLAVLLLMIASLPLSWLSPRTVILVQHPGAFDDHWVLDSAFKATRGVIFGRDVAFVYGPIFQWLMAAPSRWPHYSAAATYAGYRTLVLWCTFLFSYGALRLLLPEQPPWKRFVLLLLLSVFWAPWDGRTAFAIFLLALFLRGWYAVGEQRLKASLFAGFSALLTAVAFLYSADTGVYAIAAWLLSLCGVAWEGHRERRNFAPYAVAAGVFAASLGALVIVINSIMASPFDFRFWRTSLALVAVHRWNEPYPLSDAGALRLLLPALVCACSVCSASSRSRRSQIALHRAQWLSVECVSICRLVHAERPGSLRLQPHRLRSIPHDLLCRRGAVFLPVPHCVSARGDVGSRLLLRFCATRVAVSAVEHALSSGSHAASHNESAQPHTLKSTASAIPLILPRRSAQPCSTFSSTPTDRDPILIFPYQYMFAVAADRDVAAGVEQSFLANGPYLSQYDIDGMARAHARVGLYFADAGANERSSSALSLPIDDVSNFTRSPNLWFWIFRHYHTDRELAPGLLALQSDDSRAPRISMEEHPLGLSARNFPVPSPPTTIDLGAPDWPRGGADFLRLRIKLHYSALWKLRKPAWLQLEITRADGTRSLRTFVVEPNVISDLWFYPWNEADLQGYFDADESGWRTGQHPAITNLRLLITPLDWISQTPQSVTLESADAVRFTMLP